MWNDPNQQWMRDVMRASDDVKRGQPVIVKSKEQALLVVALEHVASSSQSISGSERHGAIVMSAATAIHLGYSLAEDTQDIAFHATVIDGGNGLALKPESVNFAPASSIESASRMLVRLSGLAPAALLLPAAEEECNAFSSVGLEDILKYMQLKPALEQVTPSAVALPLEASEAFTVLAYRDTLTHATHMAIMIGDLSSTKPPLVRIHSSCITGDVLGSLRCECGHQLKDGLKAIAEAGNGVLLYLNQEGRGIGLANKLRAYGLQDTGLDTVDANIMLGFAPDERDFSIAAQILASLGVKAIRLLTNNPAKVKALEEAGIKVVERVSHATGKGRHNEAYLATKANRMNHLL